MPLQNKSIFECIIDMKTRLFNNPLFLLFEFENKLDVNINDNQFKVTMHQRSYFPDQVDAHYVPILVELRTRRLCLDEIIQTLGYIPMFDVRFNSPCMIITTSSRMSAGLSQSSNGANESDLMVAIETIQHYIIPDEIADSVFEREMSRVIHERIATNCVLSSGCIITTALYNVPTDRPEDIIIFQPNEFATCHHNQLGYINRQKTIGYFIRRHNMLLHRVALDHIAMIKNEGYVDLYG